MKFYLLTITLLFGVTAIGQDIQSYKNDQGEKHLCGSFPIEYLQKDTTYQKWYNENYEAFALPEGENPWKENLSNTQVDIYLGTWCGDSRKWVPRFVKMWDELGLDREQLNFIALYDTDEKYKQGPTGEEKGKGIHRVPTFIFKEQDKEYARIVESPRNDLRTDLAQIALGYPSEPNYRAASYLTEVFENNTMEEFKADFNKHFYKMYYLGGKSSELNTLGYVYLRSGRIDQAVMTFGLNTRYFRYDPNVYDSFAEALAIAGKKDEAIENYEKVLSLDAENKNAIEKLAALKGE